MELPPIGGNLAQVGPVELVWVGSRQSRASRQCRHLLQEFHPLGDRLCGAQLRYLMRCPQGVLGVVCFSAAARRLRARDQWVGWNDTARGENLHRIVNNSRFLIRPGVEVRHLASHVLARALQRLAGDWQQRYGYQPWLVESFVEKAKYRGSCYRASNWMELAGSTTGRGRNDPAHQAGQTRKRIFLYPLVQKVREALRQLPEKLRLARVQPVLAPAVAPGDWAEEELGQVQLGDERLRQRLLVVARDFYARPQSHVPQSCGGDRAKTKAAYRLFDHPQVNLDAVLESHYAVTATRVAQQAVVLAAQDTTSLNYSTHPATENLGPIASTEEGVIGLLVHDTMAFNGEGTAPQTRTKLPNVRLWAVWARERHAPSGVEPVEWRLWTTLAVETFAQACQKLDWYTRRWGIEVFHRTLKSGCQIETRQLGRADRIEACLAIDLVVAWRIFHLTKLGRETPEVPGTVYFEELEWKALVGFIRQDPVAPPPPPSLRDAIRMVARLGGFLGRKGDGEPGTQTIGLGLQRLDDISAAWKVCSEILNHTVSSNRTCG